MNSLTKNCLLQYVLCIEQQLTSLRTMILLASQVEEPVETVSTKKTEVATDYLTEEAEDRLDGYFRTFRPEEASDVLG